jgi:thiamine-phosphate pyrophosphorylase
MGDTLSQNSLSKSTLYRILDANLDRAREGLRVIEEWCRFGLNQASLTAECKQLRQALALWHTAEIWASRDTSSDPGTDLTHPQEEQRSDMTQVLRVNFCRVEEALRVLEEYGKLHQPKMAADCKQMRYRVYILETSLIGQQRHQRLERSHLYLVTSPVENLFATVESALQGGVPLVQYRDKDADDSTRLHNARRLKDLCHQYNALFLMNDRVDIAIAVDADGVHLGQQDMPIAAARQLLGSQKIIGRSTTNPDEMQRAIAEGADYIGVGPVHETPTKAGKAAAGLEYVRYAATHATVPWFAIGGIDTENLQPILEAGATRVAVVRAIMASEHPTLMSQFFVSQLHRPFPISLPA